MKNFRTLTKLILLKLQNRYVKRFLHEFSKGRCKDRKFDCLFYQEGLPAEDEMFAHFTLENLKLIVEDDRSVRLLFISALFYPGIVHLEDEELNLVQHYEEKASSLIYKHIKSK